MDNLQFDRLIRCLDMNFSAQDDKLVMLLELILDEVRRINTKLDLLEITDDNSR